MAEREEGINYYQDPRSSQTGQGLSSHPFSGFTELGIDPTESAIDGSDPTEGVLFDGEVPDEQTIEGVALSNREKKRLARAAAKGMIQPDTEPVYGKGKYGKKNAAAARLREVVDEKIAKYQEGYRSGIKSLRKGKR